MQRLAIVLVIISVLIIPPVYASQDYQITKIQNTEKSNIPAWVKNNALWWAEGQINDSTFVSGIKFLIKQKIIAVPEGTPSTKSLSIPTWIKENAWWWAEGTIDDQAFVSGIQYMVSHGIIDIPQVSDTMCKGKGLCITSKIEGIVDGDTLHVPGYKVRLALVDTPEDGESGYDEATTFTKNMCPIGSTIIIDQDDQQKFDIYGRLLGKVFCGDKVLNIQLLENNHASLLTEYCKTSEFSSEDWAKKYGCDDKIDSSIQELAAPITIKTDNGELNLSSDIFVIERDNVPVKIWGIVKNPQKGIMLLITITSSDTDSENLSIIVTADGAYETTWYAKNDLPEGWYDLTAKYNNKEVGTASFAIINDKQ